MQEFPPFRLDPDSQCLWRGEERIALTPKAFAVLQFLVERNGRLVTQQQLLDGLWNGTFVQPEVLKSHILDIRNALGDDAKSPTFIETVPRRGYRFIAPVQNGSVAAGNGQPAMEVVNGTNPARRPWIGWAVAAVLLAGGSAGAGFWWRGRATPPPPSVVRFQILMPEGARLPVPNERCALSPNGKRLTFWGVSADGLVSLWVRDLDSLDGRMLPGTETLDHRAPPVWSPDSRYVAFNSEGKLKKVDAESGTVQTLCDVPEAVRQNNSNALRQSKIGRYEEQQMAAAPGLCHRFGEPGTSVTERVSGR